MDHFASLVDHWSGITALDLAVSGKAKRGQPKKTLKNQVEEETKKIGLRTEDALNIECKVFRKDWNKSNQLF